MVSQCGCGNERDVGLGRGRVSGDVVLVHPASVD